MHKFASFPVFYPSGQLIVVFKRAVLALKQRVVHVAIGGSYKCHYAILMIADVLVAAGNCTVNVAAEVLSEPKSSTQTVGLPVPAL